jgi:hypothetical protein
VFWLIVYDSNLTNVLWVEQPVGTGFSIGDVTATSEEDIAADFVGFFENFQETFGIKNFKIYVTGESCKRRSHVTVEALLTLLQMLVDMCLILLQLCWTKKMIHTSMYRVST